MLKRLKELFCKTVGVKPNTERELAQIEIFRSGSTRTYPTHTFKWIRDEIERLSTAYSPSGTNGHMEPFLAAIRSFFATNNLCEEAYWTDVWIENGRQSLVGYNKRKIHAA